MIFGLTAIALWGCYILLARFPANGAKRLPNSPRLQKPESNLETEQTESLRRQMVQYQLQDRGIKDRRVLAAMSKIPRHQFVDLSWRDVAYSDRPLPIGHSQTISQPYIVAYMSEAAEIAAGDLVLEIGTGCGYQTAVLGELAQEVYTVEVIPQLAHRARDILDKLEYQNVHIKTGDGYQGWLEHAPYQAIVVTAAPQKVPQALIDQLAEGGKLVIPVGTLYQQLLVLTKTTEGIVTQPTISVRFVPMKKITSVHIDSSLNNTDR
ncbi:MAG: protein-L-isoaspartate(D-aspartate) O-methyltransferase [Cyanobacteria bacterium J06638_38]